MLPPPRELLPMLPLREPLFILPLRENPPLERGLLLPTEERLLLFILLMELAERLRLGFTVLVLPRILPTELRLEADELCV